jgi:hypothetical protein
VRPETDTGVRAVRPGGVGGPPYQVAGIHDLGVAPGQPADLRVQLILGLEPDLVYPGIAPDGHTFRPATPTAIVGLAGESESGTPSGIYGLGTLPLHLANAALDATDWLP